MRSCDEGKAAILRSREQNAKGLWILWALQLELRQRRAKGDTEGWAGGGAWSWARALTASGWAGGVGGNDARGEWRGAGVGGQFEERVSIEFAVPADAKIPLEQTTPSLLLRAGSVVGRRAGLLDERL